MSATERPIFSGNIRRGQWGRVIRDILLLPPALLYIFIEHVFWAGAKTLLRAASRLASVNFIQAKLRGLPPLAVLPLFLVPETVSHLGGLWATLLLVDGKFLAASLAGIFVKGIATFLTVWIYQNCEPALLSVRWFAWVHRYAMRARDWGAARTAPLRLQASRLIHGGRSRLARRFAAIRSLLATRLRLTRR